MTIHQWLDEVANELADAMIPSARLDAEVILAHSLRKPRPWLHAHHDEEIDPRLKDIADARIALRLDRVPVAYIIRHKEFYGRRFYVSPDVLIPRPESESLIELMKLWLKDHPEARQLVDVGTGSGCLGITAKLEAPNLKVVLADIDKVALKVAEKNAAQHQAKVKIIRSNLLDAYPLKADIILANLPYVDRSWPVSEETKEEPALALYASGKGLGLIKQLIETAPAHTTTPSALILESDPRQHAMVAEFASQHGYKLLKTDGFGQLYEHA